MMTINMCITFSEHGYSTGVHKGIHVLNINGLQEEGAGATEWSSTVRTENSNCGLNFNTIFIQLFYINKLNIVRLENKSGWITYSMQVEFNFFWLQYHCCIILSVCRYMIDAGSDGPPSSMSLKSFILNVGARSSAPGGGSVSAAVGAMVSQ